MSQSRERVVEAKEPARTPPMDLFFASIAMAPLAVGAIALWFVPQARSYLLLNLVLFWGAALLTFLAGVRRGVSFRTKGGATASQIAMMLWLFFAGFVALFVTTWAYPKTAAVIEILGFASLALLDPIAARKGEAPLFFAHLRPLQMTVAIVSLLILVVFVWTSPLF